MFCPKCGSGVDPNAAFCRGCGAPIVAGVAPVQTLTRPGIITLLAVLQFIAATVLLLGGAIGSFAALMSEDPDRGWGLLAAVLFGGVGVLQLACGIGLWKLKPYGRVLQIVLAVIGLIGIPIGTIISIFILIYMFKPGIRALFSGKAIPELTRAELVDIAALTQGSQATTVLVVVLALIGFLLRCRDPRSHRRAELAQGTNGRQRSVGHRLASGDQHRAGKLRGGGRRRPLRDHAEGSCGRVSRFLAGLYLAGLVAGSVRQEWLHLQPRKRRCGPWSGRLQRRADRDRLLRHRRTGNAPARPAPADSQRQRPERSFSTRRAPRHHGRTRSPPPRGWSSSRRSPRKRFEQENLLISCSKTRATPSATAARSR